MQIAVTKTVETGVGENADLEMLTRVERGLGYQGAQTAPRKILDASVVPKAFY